MDISFKHRFQNLQTKTTKTLFTMKSIVALIAFFAVSQAQLLTAPMMSAPMVSATHHMMPAMMAAAPIMTAPVVSTARVTQSQWVQPGMTVAAPAVASYHGLAPATTAWTSAAAPMYAPMMTSGLLTGPAVNYMNGHLTASMMAAPMTYIRK